MVVRGSEESQERKERGRFEHALRRREAVLEAVSFAAERFLGGSDDWEENIQQVLKRLGEAAEVSRVYVCKNHKGEDGELWNSQLYKWEMPGVPPGVPTESGDPWVTYFPYQDGGSGHWREFSRWGEVLGRGEPVYGNTRDFPESERPFLVETLGILSMILVPIIFDEEWWGFIGFDDCFEEREWSVAEINALKAAASTLGASLRRWRIEGELVQSEARYGAVIEQATDGIYLVDAASRRLLETNPSLQRMLGYTADELRGMEVYEFIAHPRENVDAVIRTTLEQRRRVVGGRKYRRKNGSLVDVEVGVNVISYAGKEVICTIVRDVTERKEAEERLRTSEAELRALFEAMTDVILVVDGEGRCLKIAPTNYSLLYRPPAELLGRTLHEIFPEEHADAFLQRIRQALGPRRTVTFEYDLPIGGRQLWFEATISPMLEDSVVIVARDVTERKKNEERLRQSEYLYRTVIEQVSENICLVDAETKRIVASNPAFETALGYTSEELERMTLYDIVAHTPTSIERNVRRVVQEGRSFVGDRKYRRKDGSLLDVEVSASTILRGGRQTLCIVAHDVTERALALELLERSRERLVSAREEERKRLRRDLHDGVGPQLAALTLKLETARNLLSYDPQASALMAELSEHARATVSDVRRSVHALRPPALDELGLIGALREVAAQYSHNGLCVSVEVPGSMPPLPAAVEVAAYRIAQEAMTNAVRHARASNCLVRIALDEETGVLSLEIEDDGRGIGEKRKGGVGMHSMRERAEELGGKCTIESSLVGGTLVSAQLPSLMTEGTYPKEA
jgi:PAS domain S-box-containing protein